LARSPLPRGDVISQVRDVILKALQVLELKFADVLAAHDALDETPEGQAAARAAAMELAAEALGVGGPGGGGGPGSGGGGGGGGGYMAADPYGVPGGGGYAAANGGGGGYQAYGGGGVADMDLSR
jgi:hypothetical protein